MAIKGINFIPEPIIQKPGLEKKAPPVKPAESFQNVLTEKLAEVEQIKISAHAQKRLQERNIVIDSSDMKHISRALARAETRGVKETLLIYGNLAMVASTKNKTIVTAMHGEDFQDKVFTNIDGAVIVKKY